MATSEIQTHLDSAATFTITLPSLAASAVGVGRQSTLLTNSNQRNGALVGVQIESNGSAPTAGGTYDVYLLRTAGGVTDDNAGASDAAITVINAEPLGSLVVTNSANTKFYKVFDTTPLGPLGLTWGIAVVNNTSQALNATGTNHVCGYTYFLPQSQ